MYMIDRRDAFKFNYKYFVFILNALYTHMVACKAHKIQQTNKTKKYVLYK